MGMSDRQFDSYQARVSDLLKEIVETYEENPEKAIQKLNNFINKIESELKRP